MPYPAVLPAIGLAAGIAAGIARPSDPFLLRFLLAFTWFCGCAAFGLRRPRWFLFVIVAGFAIAGDLLGARANADAVQAPLGLLFDRHLPAGEYQMVSRIDGTLTADATPGPSGVSLRIAVDRFVFEGGHRTTRGGAVIGVGGDLSSAPMEEWREGRRLRVQATVRRPAKYLDPGVRDSQREFSWRGTSLVGSVKSPLLVDVLERGTPLQELLSATRWSIRRSVSRSVATWSERSAAVVIAILIGDRAGLDDEMQRLLQEAGTYHVIAISGGNIAILATLCVFALRWFRVGPRASAAIIIGVLVLYALIVGASGGASVGRATLMAVIYFLAQARDHHSLAGNVAALSAGLLFCVSPLEVVDAGFALTFGATLGLIVGMPMLKRPRWMSNWLFAGVALLMASVCAEIALLPVGAFVFSRVTAAGLLLNFAAIPLMTIVQISGMIAVALDHVNHPFALWTGYIAHLGVSGLTASARLVEFMPWMARRVPPPSPVLVGAYYAALVAALMMPRRTRFGFAAVAFACGWLMVTTVVVPWRTPVNGLRITFLDVGQGDAAIVQFPDGRTLSVDAGGVAGTSFDIGGRVVSPTLWALGIRGVDYMSISHSDPDHIGGAASVFRDFHPREVWEGVPVPRHEPTKALRALADGAKAHWRTIYSGDRFEIGKVRLLVHHPPLPDWERQKVRNNDSEVVELRYGGVSVVFTGDIGREVEREIAGSFEAAPIRILKVPHHGSGTSSSMEFLRKLRPTVAVISAGRGNPFGHPVPSVLARYGEIGASVFRTDLDGAITVETDGKTVRVHSFTKRGLTLLAEDHEGTKDTRTR
ncbi:MAG: DNA internalization-related competence protein ComEC/Rec2 [Vicinamibacterales bacterium]|nr:DNA internalization-related competence protein ComEC/Rec2 [Vicinamibacterales bacterium]